MLLPSILPRLQYQHLSLTEIIEGLTDVQIRKAVNPGKWSAFENMVHLATYQHTFGARVQQMLEENSPAFERYTAEADPLFHDNCTRRTKEIIQDLLITRDEIIACISTVPENELERTGLHPVYGRLNIVQWLHFFLLHEAHHLFTIFKLAAELRRG